MQKHERKPLIANRLYKAATNCPKTKVKIAEECGIDVRKLTDYLNGKHSPTSWMLADICEVIGVSMDWVCGLEREGKR